MPIVQNPSLGGNQAAMLTTTTHLTAAQIQTLNSTPVDVVPAPGAGKIIAVLGMAFVLHAGADAYHSASSDTLFGQYDGTDNDLVIPEVKNLITNALSGFDYESGSCQAPGDLLPGDDAEAVQIQSGQNYDLGPIVTAALGAGGLGYAIGDTGIINFNSADATYEVLTVGAGGAVETFSITGPGTAYATGNGVATATGGAQPGVGVGFTVNITAVQLGNGTLKVVTYYQIIPVP